MARKVVAEAEGGKPARTEFSVLASAPGADLRGGAAAERACLYPSVAGTPRGAALVRCHPLTGRTHQIRVHLAHAGHAILGDDIYGLTGPWIARHALHAAELTMAHPRTGAPFTVRAPLPPDFRAALAAVGLGDWREEEDGGGGYS